MRSGPRPSSASTSVSDGLGEVDFLATVFRLVVFEPFAGARPREFFARVV